MNWQRFVLPAAAGVLAWGVWTWSPLVLDPLGLGEFLFVGRFCLIVAALTAAEALFHKAAP